MKKLILGACLVLAPAANADILGARAGIGVWNATNTADIGQSAFSAVSEDEGVAKMANHAYFAFEHPIPVLPNIRVQWQQLENSFSDDMAATKSFGGKTFAAGARTDVALSLDAIDATAYYELLDTIVSLDLGVTGRQYIGDLSLNSTGRAASKEFRAFLPMGYAAASVNIPTTNFSFGVEGNYSKLLDNEAYDAAAYVKYDLVDFINLNLSVLGGYKVNEITLGEDTAGDFASSLRADGMFLTMQAKI